MSAQTTSTAQQDLEQSISEAHRHLVTAESANFDRMDFVWEGIRFTARSERSDDQQPVICLEASLGRLYYTVEDEFQRAAALERIFDSNQVVDGRYQVSRNGTVSFRSLTSTGRTLLGADMISAVTLILLEGETHLRALRSHLKGI